MAFRPRSNSHAGIFSEGGTNWLSCHYYDGREVGKPKLDIRQLTWTTNGWPEVQPWRDN